MPSRYFRHSFLFLLAIALTVGCDRIMPTPPVGDPSAEDSESTSADSQQAISVYFSQVADKPDRNRSNSKNIAAACAKVLGTARRTLDVCCHEIDNKVVVEAVVAAQLRGVKVRVITETDYEEELGPKVFEEAGIPVVSDKRSALMHQKFVVVDGVGVWTGSFNFTENCAYKNNNNGLYIRSPKVAANYAAWFEWFWSEGRLSARRKGGPTPNPKVQLTDGSVVETRLTTFDNMEELPLKIIRGAKTSIKFLAFSFTHKKMSAAMLEAAKRGVRVAGVFEQRNLTVSEYNKLVDQPNVAVMPDGNSFQMHHKVIIVDDQIVLAGSFNFSANATKDNDENYVVISGNPGAAKQFVEEFNRVYQQASQKLAAKENGNRR